MPLPPHSAFVQFCSSSEHSKSAALPSPVVQWNATNPLPASCPFLAVDTMHCPKGTSAPTDWSSSSSRQRGLDENAQRLGPCRPVAAAVTMRRSRFRSGRFAGEPGVIGPAASNCARGRRSDGSRRMGQHAGTGRPPRRLRCYSCTIRVQQLYGCLLLYLLASRYGQMVSGVELYGIQAWIGPLGTSSRTLAR